MRRLLFTVLLLVALTAQASTNFVRASSQYLIASGIFGGIGSIPTQSMTISFWFRTTNTVDQQVLFQCWAGAHNNYVLYRASTVNKPVGFVQAGGASGEASVSNGVVSGTWTHIVAVAYSGSSRAVFVNATKGTDATAANPNLASEIDVGRIEISGVGSNYTDGQISDLAMWNAPLTDAEVTGLSKGDSPLRVRSASLMEYWPMVNTNGGNAIGYKGYVLTNSGTTSVTGGPAIYR